MIERKNENCLPRASLPRLQGWVPGRLPVPISICPARAFLNPGKAEGVSVYAGDASPGPRFRQLSDSTLRPGLRNGACRCLVCQTPSSEPSTVPPRMRSRRSFFHLLSRELFESPVAVNFRHAVVAIATRRNRGRHTIDTFLYFNLVRYASRGCARSNLMFETRYSPELSGAEAFT